MAFNLLSLLGSQAAPDAVGQDINVEATRPTVQTSGLNLGGTEIPATEMPLEPNRLSAKQLRDQAALANLPEHKGRFGVKGTLRDVLGTLGDAFLVQSGRQPMYAPKRAQERLSDAMAGFVQDPLQAIQRVATENPVFAQKLLENYQDRGFQDQQMAAKKAEAENVASKNKFEIAAKARDRISRLMLNAKSPEDVAWVMAQAEGLADRAGLTLEDLGLGETLTPKQRSLYSAGDMTVNQQQQLPIAQQRANAATTSANRGFAPKAVTNVQTWTGEDGYQYTQRSDGSVVKSTSKVQPKSKQGGISGIAPPPAAGSGPKKGYKNKYGKVFQGGNPNDIKNWK